MEIGKTKLALTASALAMALMLAGCGGSSSSGGVSSAGGGGGTAPTVTPPTQEELDKAKADAAAAEQAKADAEKEANEAKAELSAAEKAARAEMAKMLFPTIQGGADHISNSAAPVQIDHRSGAPTIQPAGDGFTAPTPLTSVEGTEASLGDWNGMDYSHTASDRATIMARVYTNEADETMKPIGDVYDGTGDTAAGVTGATNGVLSLGTDPNHRLEADAFPAKDEGRITYPKDTDKRAFDGMFQGAPGEYECTGDDACTATWTATGVQLGGAWTFDPDDGASVIIPDPGYVSFGWWLRKDNQGAPSHVEAFFDAVGDATAETTIPVAGSAEYNGKAVGKFAILDNPKGESNAGHFTADAKLTATFATTSSLKGELTAFKANEEDVDWKVTLNKAAWNSTDNKFEAATMGTVWSIGGLAGTNTGSWEAQAYETPQNSNVPGTVAGTFNTQFGETHKMSGAFGATK